MTRLECVCAAALIVLASVVPAGASPIAIRQIDLEGGLRITGTVTTDGTVGSLTAANFVDWRILVAQTLTQRFTGANSSVRASSGLSSDAGGLSVTNPDGSLVVSRGSGRHPFTVQLADFTDPSLPGGQAGYFSPFDFQVLPFLTLDPSYLLALADPIHPDTFQLTPLDLGDGYSVAGTVRTNGTAGALESGDLVDWDITVTQTIVENLFTRGDSRIVADMVSSDGTTVWVANPDGVLAFVKGAGFHPFVAQLADFTTAPGGEAGYRSPFGLSLVSPLTSRHQYAVAGTDLPSVPEPSLLSLLGLAAIGGGLRARVRVRR